jgi:NADP-dependent 3-hydroxy acid dehydrogenase YdfG
MSSADFPATASARSSGEPRVAVVTGASAGIGEATARTLAAQGFHVVAVARRADRINALAAEIGGTAVVADVTDGAAVDELAGRLSRVDVLVNNAGGAKGLESVADADLEHWRWMWETNVLGTLRVTRALLPKLIASGDGLIVTVTSIAAMEIYDGGSGYTAAKHAQGALHRTLRVLTAADVAEVIGFVASRPPHVNLDQIIIRPRDQASATRKFTHPAAG